VGARVLVKPGERIPLDGLVVKGSTSVNQAPITGESMPVAKGIGDNVFAGSINESGAFEFETSKPAKDTTLARIIQMVEEAQSRRAPSEQWVESFARYYTPAMMVLALAIAVLPPLLFSQPFEPWFYKSLVLLVIACPCALVISTPVSIVAGLSAAAKAGILIKGGAYLEAPSRLRVIAMDKTGTLTKGEPEVRQIIPFSGHDERELLERAAALEAHSEHPLARAILRKASEAGITPAPAEDFKAIKGKGAEATIDGRRFWIGSHRLLHEKLGEAAAMPPQTGQLEATGHAIVATGDEKRIAGLIGVSDIGMPVPQSDWSQKSVMLIGGNDASTKSMAELLSVDERDVKLLTCRAGHPPSGNWCKTTAMCSGSARRHRREQPPLSRNPSIWRP
jgi:Cd2+/Zn2+-exporting ATPase